MITFKELKRNLRKDFTHLPSLKIALLGDTATQLLGVSIKGLAMERGYNFELMEADYNQVERQVLDPTSDLHQWNPDYTIVFQSTHKLLERYCLTTLEDRNSLAEDRLDFIRSLCRSVRGRIIYYNYSEIEDGVFGSYANKVKSSFTYQVRRLNFQLMELAQESPNLFICDLAGLQNKFGRDVMFNSQIYVSTEMVLSLDILPYVASRTVDIICALEGKFKKCLILDLDNTLWGGVVGDDGWENIHIGHGVGIGKAFTEFQRWIKVLKNRGILIAICSKNDEDKARSPFERNHEMVLKIDDISVFVANWENKADNIRIIQSILNIGFDTMVFLDDNPFERNLVRDNIPDICVPELPEDPAEYLEHLYALNLFETGSYSDLDNERTLQYQIEGKRTSLLKTFTNEADFLRSLNMVSDVNGFSAFNKLRVSQLSQRSNQFNLRTVRYTEAEIDALQQDERFVSFSFTLADKFGDNGLICVVVLKKLNEDVLFVENWFMSCRVLKRGMEDFTLQTLVTYAREHNFKRIIGEYRPTAKNQLVANHYQNLGFIPLMTEDENLCFELAVENYLSKENHITSK